MTVYWVLLCVIACERVAELVVSARHANALLRRGGVEYGFGHFPVMIALHVALIAGCVIEPLAGHRTFIPALGWTMLAVTVAGGSQEMQRNGVSERVLGLPREATPDRGVPFSEVLASRRSQPG